jgi:hypothetical protein
VNAITFFFQNHFLKKKGDGDHVNECHHLFFFKTTFSKKMRKTFFEKPLFFSFLKKKGDGNHVNECHHLFFQKPFFQKK